MLCSQTDSAQGALQESQRKVLLLEAMVSALRERLREEETRNLQLQGEGGEDGGRQAGALGLRLRGMVQFKVC